MLANRAAWAEDLLGRLGFPISVDNLIGLVAWELQEGGWFNNNAQYNPLNTTQPAPGAVDINSVGVKAYPDYETGMAATITTLNNGNYPGILDALHNDRGPAALADAVANSPWGTGHINPLVIDNARTIVDDWTVGHLAPPDPYQEVPMKATDVIAVLVDADGAYQLTAGGGVDTVQGPFYGSPLGETDIVQAGFELPFRAITRRPDGKPGYTCWDSNWQHRGYTYGEDHHPGTSS